MMKSVVLYVHGLANGTSAFRENITMNRSKVVLILTNTGILSDKFCGKTTVLLLLTKWGWNYSLVIVN